MIFQGRDELRFADGSTAQKVAPVTTSGSAVNPAREDGNLASLLAATDYVVSAAYRVTIDSTSRSLAALAGVPSGLSDSLLRIAIVREDGTADQVRFQFNGAATSGAPQWPSAGIDMPMTAAQARALYVVSSGGTIYATLFVMTPRN
jgi:hypothetical protein